MTNAHAVFVTVGLLSAFVGTSRSTQAEEHWPQWRGPMGTGAASDARPPVEWSETNNVRWKVAIEGRGHSTPIIWGHHVFLTTAVPFGEHLPPRFSTAPGTHDGVPVTQRHRFVVLAVNRADGKRLWQRTLHESLPHEGGHSTGSLASNSPVTDGEHLFVSFGTHGLYCLDFDGNLRWQTFLGQMQTVHGHGEASSPVLFGDTLVVNWDHEGQSFVVAFNKRTGEQCWKVLRDEVTSWATPIIAEHHGQAQLIVSGTKRVRGYDLATGRELWQCGGLSANVVASPVAAGGMVFVGSSYDKRALLAILLEGADGDITDTNHVAWSRSRGTPYVPSPLLYEESLYFLTHYQGILTRVHARTGADQPGAIRLGSLGDIYSSPVAADGRVYVTSREGLTAVIRHADEPQTLAMNQLNDLFNASAALAGPDMFLRGEKWLYCLSEKKSP